LTSEFYPGIFAPHLDRIYRMDRIFLTFLRKGKRIIPF
jgi:hypothetical protein